MYCAKNVLLGKRVKQLWGHIMVVVMVCVFLRRLPLPECVFYTSKDVTIKTHLLSWPYEHTMDAKIDSKEPHIALGQNNRHLLSLTRCVGPACPRFHVYHFFSLSASHDYLVPPMQRGNSGQGAFSPSVQTSVNIYHRAVTWICSYLSECYSKFSDYCCYSESLASRGEG